MQIRCGTASSSRSILCIRRRGDVLPIYEIRAPVRLLALQHHPVEPGRGVA